MLQATVIDTQQAANYLSTINWFQPSWDMFIVGFFMIASLIYGVSLGRDRILVLLVSIYMSLAVVKYVPFITNFNASISLNDAFALRVSVFLGLFILLFFFLSQSALLRTLGAGAEQGAMWQVILFSILHAGLLISVTLSFFPTESSQFLSPLTQKLFVSDVARAAWAILPVAAMAVLGAKRES
jgi:hypothetical protein